MSEGKFVRGKPIPKAKVKLVDDVSGKLKSSKTVLIASCKSLPSSQFQAIKKKLRGKAEIKFMKKTALSRAIDKTEKGSLQELKKEIGADFAVFFSDMDAFELSALLTENQVPTKAKPGDIALSDLKIEPGPTDLMPGPAISELGSVGLKVAVKDGKLEITEGATVVKEGEKISEKVASILGKLNINPMKVGFIPLAAYDSESDKVYVGIKIDKEGTLEELKTMLGKALGFAINRGYVAKETISYFIAKASAEERTLGALVGSEKVEEKPVEEGEQASEKEEEKPEEKVEEKAEEDVDDQKDTKEESA